MASPAVCGLLIGSKPKWSTVVLATTVNVMGLPVPGAKAPLETVIVTDPAVVPVTVMFATPPEAVTDVRPDTLPRAGRLREGHTQGTVRTCRDRVAGRRLELLPLVLASRLLSGCPWTR